MGLKNNRPDGQYVSILGSDGSFRVASEEGAEGAIRRDYETSDGKKGTKWELIFTELSGLISDISIQDGNYGRTINVSVGDGDDKFILATNSDNNFGTDLMKKLPNIDLTKEVVFTPYSFDGDDGKKKKGLSIKQDDQKIQSFFWDPKKEKISNGLPEVDEAKKPDVSKKTAWKKFWASYFGEVEEFLVEYTEGNVIPKIVKQKEDSEDILKAVEYDEEEEGKKEEPKKDF